MTFLRWFPIKANSFDEFIELVQRNDGKFVDAQPVLDTKDAAETATGGMIGTLQFSFILKSKASNGRKIIYREVCVEQFGSESGLADREKRRLSALKGLIITDKRLRRIRAQLGITTRIVGFNEADYQQLYEDAQKYGIDYELL